MSGETPSINDEQLLVNVEPGGPGPAVISLSGELDLSMVPRLEKPLFRELRSNGDVILDLTGVTFIDSSGIGLLVRAFRHNEDPDVGRLHTVVADQSQVDRVFELAGMDRALSLYETRASALEAIDETEG